MWKSSYFSAIQILREINSGYLRMSETAIFAVFQNLSFDFNQFQTSKEMQNIFKFSASKNVKSAVLKILELLKLISRKIWVAGKLSNFQLVLLNIGKLIIFKWFSNFDVIQSSHKDQVEVTLVWFISWRPSFFELYNRQSNCYIVNPL